MWKWVEKEGIGTSTKILLAVSTCARPRGFPREEVGVSVQTRVHPMFTPCAPPCTHTPCVHPQPRRIAQGGIPPTWFHLDSFSLHGGVNCDFNT